MHPRDALLLLNLIQGLVELTVSNFEEVFYWFRSLSLSRLYGKGSLLIFAPAKLKA